MADKSRIEWTDATWNPVRARRVSPAGDAENPLVPNPQSPVPTTGWHCEHVSEGCRNCYAEKINRRLGTGLDYKPASRRDLEIFLDEKTLTQPLRWKRPRRIFVGSMTDLFADFVTDAMLDRIFAVMALSPRHTFQALTKRPERMHGYLSMARAHPVGLAALDETLSAYARDPSANVGAGVMLQGDICHLQKWPLPNVWLGVSAEDQATAEARIPPLLATPATKRFLSAEPLLGRVDLTNIPMPSPPEDEGRRRSALVGNCIAWIPPLDWVIAGGESGPGARPAHPDWFRTVRDQCEAAGVPFFFKQWGSWAPRAEVSPRLKMVAINRDGSRTPHDVNPDDVGGQRFVSVWKSEAGALLDGREHREFPT